MIQLFRNNLIVRYATFFIIFFLLSVIAYLLLARRVSPESMPDFLALITANPLISAIFAALVVLLPITAIQSSTDRVKTLESRIDETRSKFDASVDEKIESKIKGVLSRAVQLDDKLHNLERDHEWLRLFSKSKPYLDAKTAVAAFESTFGLIEAGNLNYAYTWLSNAMDEAITGDRASFDALALLALVFYDDTYLANRFLAAGRGTHQVSADTSLVLHALIAFEAGTITSDRALFERLAAALVPQPFYYPSQIRVLLTETTGDRLRRQLLKKAPAAYVAVALYLLAIADLDRLKRLVDAAAANEISLAQYPFASKMFERQFVADADDSELNFRVIWGSFAHSAFDQRSEFITLLDEGRPAEARALAQEVQSKVAITREDRVYQLWFTVNADRLTGNRRPPRGRRP